MLKSSDLNLTCWWLASVSACRVFLVHHVHLTSVSCILGFNGICDSVLSALLCWWKQYHGTASSGIDCLDRRNRDSFVWCVLVNRPHYHDIVIVVRELETEDPQLVAEPGVGRNHGEAMGKS